MAVCAAARTGAAAPRAGLRPLPSAAASSRPAPPDEAEPERPGVISQPGPAVVGLQSPHLALASFDDEAVVVSLVSSVSVSVRAVSVSMGS